MRPTTASHDRQSAIGHRPSLPRHIAIIMDGNGRWARRRGLGRALGHQQGAQAVRPIVTECAGLGVEVLTLYSFSLENWKRPAEEVAALMELYVQYMRSELPTMMENNVRFATIGRRQGLPGPVLEEVDRTIAATSRNSGLTLVLAINYGARAEIVDAVRSLARDAAAGSLDPESIDEAVISDRLYTRRWPDPDLLIRTAGEMRISNYLLWQISYAELYVADTLWPDFDVPQLHKALDAYARRERRFGAVEPKS